MTFRAQTVIPDWRRDHTFGWVRTRGACTALVSFLVSFTFLSGAVPPAHAASVAAGGFHSLLLRADGTLWGWGDGIYGALGEGTTGSRSVPVQIQSGVQAVAAGENHTLALKADGTLWAYGRNSNGQIGDGAIGTRAAPVQVLSNVQAIAAGDRHSLAIKRDGTLWAWGWNTVGQLGDGTTITRTSPVHVLSGVRFVAAGSTHSFAIKNDGTLWAWGSNSSGQLGDGTSGGPALRPVPILNDAQSVAAGSSHSLLLKTDGSLWAFGSNSAGQLGTGATSGPQAMPVLAMNGVRAIAARGSQSLALRTDGTLWAWGRNDLTQSAATNPANIRPSPLKVLSGVESMATGFDHAVALLTDGTMRAWGGNSNGQLGDGTTVTRGAPVHVMEDVESVAAGLAHSIAVKKDGTLWTWGYNWANQLGDGTNTHRGRPTQVLGGVKFATAGVIHTLAIRSDGMLWAWGSNARGQLGNGTTLDGSVPAPVMLGTQAAAAGFSHSLALKTDGTLWSWGGNDSGQLGDGTKTDRRQPRQIMSDVKAVAAGELFSIALKTDGTVWTWGSNLFGQLGDGTRVERTAPVHVQSGVEAIEAGWNHSIALKSDGSVWTWGLNSLGQLGLGTTTTGTRPARVMDGVRSIAAGAAQSLALKADGSMWGWGVVNIPGAGLVTQPNLHPFLPAIRSMAAGSTHALAVTTDGRLLAWGSNGWQQLGIERPVYSSEPLLVRDPLGSYAGTSVAFEYFNPTILNGAGTPGIGHHFLTADGAEMTSIDTGGSGPGWSRTGRGFRVWLQGSSAPPDAVPVHRFYARAPNSHFYTANDSEQQALRAQNPANDPRVGWAYEGIAFYSILPIGGRCPADYFPVYRAYNNRFDTDPSRNDGNHRISPSFNDHQRSVQFLGYVDEGIAFCSPANPLAGGDLQATYSYPGATAESGSSIRSEFLFGNNGTGNADGSSIYVALPSTVGNWSVTCTSRLGAVCPSASSVSSDALRTGVKVSNWPAGGTLALVAIGSAPPIDPQGGSLLQFAATVVSASGSPDATPNNDTPPTSQTALKAAMVCSPTVNPRSLHLGADAQTPKVGLVIGEGCGWSSASDSDWVTINPATGTGDSAIRLELAANESTASRVAKLTIGGQEITVVQSGTPCTFSVAPMSVSFRASGGAITLQLTAPHGCLWTVENGGASWLSASPSDGSGSGTISLAASTNVGANGRNGSLVIGNAAVPVTQGRAGEDVQPPLPSPRPDPCSTMQLQREGDQVAPTGVSGAVGVDVIADGDCRWQARSNVEWVTLTAGGGGNGNGVVRYLVAANPMLQARQGTITIGEKVFTVNQTANPVEPGNSDGGGDGSGGGSSGGGSGGAAG
jgi:alpha-tubulin suppressor-like RCC1 family protein